MIDRTGKLKQGLPVGITMESAGQQKKKPKKKYGYDSSDEEEKAP